MASEFMRWCELRIQQVSSLAPANKRGSGDRPFKSEQSGDLAVSESISDPLSCGRQGQFLRRERILLAFTVARNLHTSARDSPRGVVRPCDVRGRHSRAPIRQTAEREAGSLVAFSAHADQVRGAYVRRLQEVRARRLCVAWCICNVEDSV